MFEYAIKCKFKTGNLLPEMKQLEDSVNSFMSGFGYHEKMSLWTESELISLTSNIELTEEQQFKVLRDLNLSFQEKGMDYEALAIRLL